MFKFGLCLSILLSLVCTRANYARADEVSLCISRMVKSLLQEEPPPPPKGKRPWNEYEFLDALAERDYDEFLRVTSELSNAEYQKYLLEAQNAYHAVGTPAHSNPRSTWTASSFTLPTEHDPKKFTYLVHAIPNAQGMKQWVEWREDHMVGEKDVMKLKQINLISQPERITEIPRLSCSVISDKKLDTFASMGVILDTKPDNVLITHHEDAGTGSFDYYFNPEQYAKRIAEDVRQFPTILTPKELLAKESEQYNEVVLLTHTDKNKVRVTGFFIKIDKNGKKMISDYEYQQIKKAAAKSGLPIIKIKDE